MNKPNRKGRIRRAITKRLPEDQERLTFHPLVKVLLNAVALPSRLLHPEFRSLPPNHLRCRVGAGGKSPPWANETAFLRQGYHHWMEFFGRGLLNLSSNIVEIGCGCGRNAYVLKQFQDQRHQFVGTYFGIDIDREAVDWCQAHLANDHFHFDVSAHRSRFYKTNDTASNGPLMSLDTASQDLVFATAVFSHLLEAEVREYIGTTARILRPGGHIFFNLRCVEHLPPRHRARFATHHQGAFVVDPDKPEKSVAFRESDIRQILIEHGFTDMHLEPRGPLNHVMIARRAPTAIGAGTNSAPP